MRQAMLAMCLAWATAMGALGATPPEPTYGSATKDGNPDTGGPGAEWQYRPSAGFPLGYDFWGVMYVGGDANKPRLGLSYLRYDCSTQTMYVLVSQQGFPGTGTSPPSTSSSAPTGRTPTCPRAPPFPRGTWFSGPTASPTPAKSP